MSKRRTCIMIDADIDRKIRNRMADRIKKTQGACSYSNICAEIFAKEFKIK